MQKKKAEKKKKDNAYSELGDEKITEEEIKLMDKEFNAFLQDIDSQEFIESENSEVSEKENEDDKDYELIKKKKKK